MNKNLETDILMKHISFLNKRSGAEMFFSSEYPIMFPATDEVPFMRFGLRVLYPKDDKRKERLSGFGVFFSRCLLIKKLDDSIFMITTVPCEVKEKLERIEFILDEPEPKPKTKPKTKRKPVSCEYCKYIDKINTEFGRHKHIEFISDKLEQVPREYTEPVGNTDADKSLKELANHINTLQRKYGEKYGTAIQDAVGYLSDDDALERKNKLIDIGIAEILRKELEDQIKPNNN